MSEVSRNRADAVSRAAVFGYRLRFSPDTHSIRQTVVDHLVLMALRDFDAGEGASIGNLTAITVGDVTVANLSLGEVRQSLGRLERDDLILSKVVRKKPRWVISAEGRKRLGNDEAAVSANFERAAELLFGGDARQAQPCFVRCLSLVFDQLATSYVESIAARGNTQVLSDSMLDPIVARALGEHPDVSRDLFSAGVRRFFCEKHPVFDSLKWTFCQNYYLVRAIGVASDSGLLSRGLFEGSAFFLDTNVLLVALDSTSPHHASVKQVLQSLRAISCTVGVLRPTLDELRQLASGWSENLEKTLSQIPDALLPRVRGFLARAEARHRKDSSEPTAREVLKRFEDPHHLLDELEIELVDDPWFADHEEDDGVKALALRLLKHYNSTSQGRKKSPSAAAHDALALTWLDRAGPGKKHFLTLDASLPSLPPMAHVFGGRQPPALSSYAVLPWLGSVVMAEGDDAASAYSALLSAQLLAMGTRFTLSEFRLLADLELQCKSLPPEDVEQCLLHLRREVPNADVSKAEDRERLHHAVRSFFASPERKYPAELAAAVSRIEALESERARQEEERTKEVEDLKRQHDEVIRKERGGTDDYRRRWQQQRVKFRLAMVALCYAVLLAVSVGLAHLFGTGENLVQKIGNTWWLIAVSTGLAAVGARWSCRGELWTYAKELLWPLHGDSEQN